ncbi:MAG: YncE family protein [Micropruina sp.]|nr:YncE family protein [Micropruina sp.]
MNLFVSANDAKLVRDFGRDAFPHDPGPDTLTLIDLDGARVLATVPVQTSIVGPPQAVALSPDGSLAAVAAPTSYDRAAGALRFADVLQVVRLHADPPTVEAIPIGAHPQSVAFTPDGARLLASTVSGEVLVFGVDAGVVTLRQRLVVSTGSLSGLGVLADGSAAIVSLRDEQGAVVIDLTGPEAVLLPQRVATGVSPYAIDTDASARWAVIGSVGWGGKAVKGGACVADADLITLVDTSARPFRAVDHAAVPSIPEGVAISPDGAWVAALCMAGTQVPPGEAGHSPSGRLVLFANDDGRLRRVDSLPTGAAAQGLAFAADSVRLVAQLYADRCLGVYEIADDGLRDTGTRIAVPGGPASLRRG